MYIYYVYIGSCTPSTEATDSPNPLSDFTKRVTNMYMRTEKMILNQTNKQYFIYTHIK